MNIKISLPIKITNIIFFLKKFIKKLFRLLGYELKKVNSYNNIVKFENFENNNQILDFGGNNYLTPEELTKENIFIGKNVAFKEKPIIQVCQGSRLFIGNNVTVNSDNNGYHVNMYARCKIIIDRPNAIVSIGDDTRIHGTCIHAYEKVIIGKKCLIAANCQIFDGNGHDLSFQDIENRINTTGTSKPIIIEDSVWLGTGVVVLPGVKIGKGSIISANSVVHQDVPPMVIAGGNPLRIIKDYNS